MAITICHNKPPDRKLGWSVDDVMPRRDGPENLRILKKSHLDFDHWKSELDFERWKMNLGFSDLYRQRSKTSQDAPRVGVGLA